MATYLLTWNPDTSFKWDDIRSDAQKVDRHGSAVDRWSFGNRTSAEIGDRFFLIKQGVTKPKGIVASGWLTSEPYQDAHWNDSGALANYVTIEFDGILVPESDEILDREVLNDPEFSAMHWDAQSSGTQIPNDVARALEEMWSNLLVDNGKPRPKPSQLLTADRIPDGITRDHLIGAIERVNSGYEHAFADSTGYDVLFDGSRYAPKAVVGIASELVTGEKFGPYDFKGGLQSKCFRVLKQNGFEVVPKDHLFEYIKSADPDLATDLSEIESSAIKQTEKMQLCKARIGQGKFRERVEKIERFCRVTGVADRRVLNASHIKPWKSCTNAERLDGSNGLLLSAHIDRLFDRGLISFADTGEVLVKDRSVQAILKAWNVNCAENVKPFSTDQSKYLQHHRQKNGFH